MFNLDPYEKEIVEGCKREERKYQKALYDRYKDSMYTILFRMTGSKNDAADLLQDAFIDVFKSLPTYQYKSTIGAWIKTIVIRKAVKSQKKKIHFAPIEDGKLNVPIVQEDDNLTGYQLEKCILQLPEGFRTVFLLIAVHGYTHKEVAEFLNISVGTSKSQFARARKKLQIMLSE